MFTAMYYIVCIVLFYKLLEIEKGETSFQNVCRYTGVAIVLPNPTSIKQNNNSTATTFNRKFNLR